VGLLDRFRASLIIAADGNELIFCRDSQELRQLPVIRVASDGKIIELGSAAISASGGRFIELFRNEDSDANQALRAFCRYHMLLISPGAFGLRPRVTVLEQSIRQAFGNSGANEEL
jgi:hypothetical protein